jgi:hypothetical protein
LHISLINICGDARDIFAGLKVAAELEVDTHVISGVQINA